ncbi:hypothetical protein BDR26DRAFT_862029 [Obelidium mucronatum]|nr:hypothetical protein BDR26DRAFT_862029 [Obelidium mucronatum]
MSKNQGITCRGALTSGLILGTLGSLFATTSFIGGATSSPAILAQVASVTLTSTANPKVYTPPSGYTSVKLTNWGLCYLTNGNNPKCIAKPKFTPFLIVPGKSLLKPPSSVVSMQTPGTIDPFDAAALLPASFNPMAFLSLAFTMALLVGCIGTTAFARVRLNTAGKKLALRLMGAACILFCCSTGTLVIALASTIAFSSSLNNLIMAELSQFQITTTVSVYEPLFLAAALVCSGCGSWMTWRAKGLFRMELAEALENDRESLRSSGSLERNPRAGKSDEALLKNDDKVVVQNFAPFTIGRR